MHWDWIAASMADEARRKAQEAEKKAKETEKRTREAEERLKTLERQIVVRHVPSGGGSCSQTSTSNASEANENSSSGCGCLSLVAVVVICVLTGYFVRGCLADNRVARFKHEPAHMYAIYVDNKTGNMTTVPTVSGKPYVIRYTDSDAWIMNRPKMGSKRIRHVASNDYVVTGKTIGEFVEVKSHNSTTFLANKTLGYLPISALRP